jgi:ammonium transporter Rh
MLCIAVVEVVIYSFNEALAVEWGIVDVGGSIIIHMFGAFFGVGLSLALRPRPTSGDKNNSALYYTDVFAMIGSLFLWLYWPSFNAILAHDNTRHRAILNTVLSISASAFIGFVSSYGFGKGKFDMVHVQNATLAGGVAMGACADLDILPGSAVLIGSLAGVLSVWGYVKLSPWLEAKIGLYDTCGVNNLHGLPSLLAAAANMLVIGTTTDSQKADYGEQYGMCACVCFCECDHPYMFIRIYIFCMPRRDLRPA